MAVIAPGVQRCVDSHSGQGEKCYGPCQCSSFVESPEPVELCAQCDEVEVIVWVPHAFGVQTTIQAGLVHENV